MARRPGAAYVGSLGPEILVAQAETKDGPPQNINMKMLIIDTLVHQKLYHIKYLINITLKFTFVIF